jgi:hypothetical protein
MEKKLFFYKADVTIEGEYHDDYLLILPEKIDNYAPRFYRPVTGVINLQKDILYVNKDYVHDEIMHFYTKEVAENHYTFNEVKVMGGTELYDLITPGDELIIGDGALCYLSVNEIKSKQLELLAIDCLSFKSKDMLDFFEFSLVVEVEVYDFDYYCTTPTYIINNCDLFHPYSHEYIAAFIECGYMGHIHVHCYEEVEVIESESAIREIENEGWMYDNTPQNITDYLCLL